MKVKKQNGELTKTNLETTDEMSRAFQSMFMQENECNIHDFDVGFKGQVIKDHLRS